MFKVNYVSWLLGVQETKLIVIKRKKYNNISYQNLILTQYNT